MRTSFSKEILKKVYSPIYTFYVFIITLMKSMSACPHDRPLPRLSVTPKINKHPFFRNNLPLLPDNLPLSKGHGK